MNEALGNSLPVLNKLLTQYAPETVGNCKYPGAPGTIPQPCFEYGRLNIHQSGVYRITSEWMSGMRSMQLSNISVIHKETLAAATQPVGWAEASEDLPVLTHRFELDVAGLIRDPSMFLKIEECEKNHTTLEAITGEGLCKPFLDTADACCEPNRRFSIKIASECHPGETNLVNTRVVDMRLDTMTVRPEMWRGRVRLLIADKNITNMVLETVQTNIMWYLTKVPLLEFHGESLDVMEFVNRVLRFNAPNQQFHCSAN